MGLDDAAIARIRAKAEAQVAHDQATAFHLWPEHVNTYLLFHQLRRQFVVGPMGGFMGIPIPAKESLFNIHQIHCEDRSALLDDLQLIEDGVLMVINSKNG
ncbi:MAG: DUF1799 domain-containing protein [Alteromonadaceae bacterium]|nr:DUF1799 domain-containing protein [Alteromonadaceae bacterium]